MSPKGILITFAVVSLLLIGIMFLAVDGRNNPVLENNDITKTIEEGKEREKKFIDSLESLGTEKPKDFTPIEILNTVTEDLLAHIKSLQEALFPGGLAAHDLKQSDRVVENNVVFFKENGEYTQISKQFISKLDHFESLIHSVKKTSSNLANINVEVRESYTGKQDWLRYNYKDFPAVASYSKLKLLEEAIKRKKEAIIKVVLTNE